MHSTSYLSHSECRLYHSWQMAWRGSLEHSAELAMPTYDDGKHCTRCRLKLQWSLGSTIASESAGTMFLVSGVSQNQIPGVYTQIVLTPPRQSCRPLAIISRITSVDLFRPVIPVKQAMMAFVRFVVNLQPEMRVEISRRTERPKLKDRRLHERSLRRQTRPSQHLIFPGTWYNLNSLEWKWYHVTRPLCETATQDFIYIASLSLVSIFKPQMP